MTTSLLSTVYLNEARGSFLGFHTSDEAPALRQAASFELTMPETPFCDTAVYAALEVVFEQLNIDHPTAAWALDYRRRGNRSRARRDRLGRRARRLEAHHHRRTHRGHRPLTAHEKNKGEHQ